ncbi:hypothetical protein M0R45_007497 [Rubus argutus]|uniref:Uncharacterized protein n=1 Tax=Rubus argutus TaxID=59490 RepID=A0AAW1Y1A6_RUBAR
MRPRFSGGRPARMGMMPSVMIGSTGGVHGLEAAAQVRAAELQLEAGHQGQRTQRVVASGLTMVVIWQGSGAL